MTPTLFQSATADAVIAALRDPLGAGRFLVADEVGMGKTVVAKAVIRSLLDASPNRSVHVLYVCSNLAVARQNRDALLRVDGLSPKDQERAQMPADRLAVVPRMPDCWKERRVPAAPPLRLFTLTPGTSLPDWKAGRSGTGTMYERATVQALLDIALKQRLPAAALQATKSNNWPSQQAWAWKEMRSAGLSEVHLQQFLGVLSSSPGLDSTALGATLLADAKRLPDGRRPYRSALITRLGELRAAACCLALDLLAPDLVIFDEFQRFSELVTVGAPCATATGRNALISRLRGDNDGPRVPLLLLSATPYSAHRGEADSHGALLSLVRFLLGGSIADEKLHRDTENRIHELESGLAGLRRAFVNGKVDDAALSERDRAEAVLRRVMARTERSDAEEMLTKGVQSAHATASTGPYGTAAPTLFDVDLLMFRHMMELRKHRGGRPGPDVAFWASVPLPTQMMANYKSAALLSAKGDPKPPKEAHLTERAIQKLRTTATRAHPRMRALLDVCPAERLALPWVAPCLPWWPLGGGWARTPEGVGGPTKVLAFSRFVAVPRAVPALLSHAVEAAVFKGERPKRLAMAFETGGKARAGLLALFTPIPFLVEHGNPLAAIAKLPRPTVATVRREVANELGRALRESFGRLPKRQLIVGPVPARPHWRALALLVGADPAGVGRGLQGGGWLPQGVSEGATRKAWLAAVTEGVGATTVRISPAELEYLAELALAAPGNILARSLQRHQMWTEGEADAHRVRALAWGAWRATLGHAVVTGALDASCRASRRASRASKRGANTAPARLLEATLAGNLESVLDEHLWTLCGQQDPARAFQSFMMQLGRPYGSVSLRDAAPKGKGANVRTHVALPFRGDAKSASSGGAAGAGIAIDLAARPEQVRSCFNSPFWPHVLVTTSVGQEGLDFHPWCARIAHWDLPGGPVDYEQREGRIQRYAGLAVRRAIARGVEARLGPIAAAAVKTARSVWTVVADTAREKTSSDADPSLGLAPWWVHPDGGIERLFLDVSGSEMEAYRKRLDRERELYRLVLGQPDQARLMRALLQADVADMAKLRLRLSPGFNAGGRK